MRNTKWTKIGILAAGLLLPLVSSGETFDSLSGYNKFVKDGISSYGQTLGSIGRQVSRGSTGNPVADLRASLDETLAQLQENTKRSDLEVEKRGKVTFWRKKNDDNDTALLAMDAFKQKVLDGKNALVKALSPSINAVTAAMGGVQGSQLTGTLKNAEKACKTDVDFDGAANAQALTVPAARLTGMLNNVAKESKESFKKQTDAAVAATLQKFQAQNKNKNEFQTDITKADALKESGNLDGSIAFLDKMNKDLKQRSEDGERKLFDSFAKLVKETQDLQENDERVAQTAASVAAEWKDSFAKKRDEAYANVKQVEENCAAQADILTGGDTKTASFAAAKNFVNKLYTSQIDAPVKASELGKISARQQQLAECTANASQVKQAFAEADVELARMSTITEPRTLAVQAAAVLGKIGGIYAKVDTIGKKSISTCNSIAQEVTANVKLIQGYADRQKEVASAGDPAGGGGAVASAAPRTGASRQGGVPVSRPGSLGIGGTTHR